MNNNRFRCSGSTSRSNCCSTGGYRSFTPAKAMKMKLQKEYPPPLPSLGMEMKRYCTGDGRLIIREEKTSRPLHDMFRADRSNGRLTLHFMRLEDLNDSVLRHDVDDGDVFQMDDDDDQEVMPVCSSVIKHDFGKQKRVLA